MKFKSSHAQNQRIERITASHLIIGIDIAKEIHVARAVNYRGIEFGRTLAFSNDHTGFEKLLYWLNNLKNQSGCSESIFGLESTGQYWFCLADWLLDRQQEVVLVNPLTTKRNKENRDNCQSKSDAKDALVIAEVVARGYYSDLRVHEEIYRRLRKVMNEREYWSDQSSNIANRIIRWLDIHFPEFTRIFAEWHGTRALATLKEFPLPEDVRELTPQQVIEGWKKHMKRSGGITGLGKAAELIHAARRSVGDSMASEEGRAEIGRLIAYYENLTETIQEFEEQVAALLNEIPEAKLLSTIKGFSPTLIAVILANTGNLKQFDHGHQVLSLAGLNLAESTSGKRKGQIVISKCGRRQLRKYLYLAMMLLVANNPTFKKWHNYNVQERKMKKQRSLFKLIGKLVRIMVAMARNGRPFQTDSEINHPEAA